MSDKNEWIKEAIDKKFFKFYDFNDFSNIKKIGDGGFGTVYRAKWKNSDQCVALKTFKSFNNDTAKEIAREVIIYILVFITFTIYIYLFQLFQIYVV
jgi:serine/threonine protein kinase